MSTNKRNLLLRALLILQHTLLKNRTLIVPAFSEDLKKISIESQLDVKKFLIYWSDQRVRLPNFLLLDQMKTVPVTNLVLSMKQSYADVKGIINFSIDSIPLDLPAPSPYFDVFIRDSLLWCWPPIDNGIGWCIHHPKDFGATMEILFACRGDPYPPCANKTEVNEQWLHRPYDKS
jgi:hypothetical protein